MPAQVKYVVMLTGGRSVAECYCGAYDTVEEAMRVAWATKGDVHPATEAGVAKIEAAAELDRQLLETIRTGLSRRVRGVR